MIRRAFLGLTAAAGGFAVLRATHAPEKKVAAYQVDGFWCPTCSVGTETLLLREKGVLAAEAAYPSGRTTVTYDARLTSTKEIAAAIKSMGFHAKLL